MRLNAQNIKMRCSTFGMYPLIFPFNEDKIVIHGKSAGLSAASYDCCIDHDLTLGINPALIIQKGMLEDWSSSDVRMALSGNPPYQALAYTVEDFHMPDDLSADVADKSSYARQFVGAFNTFIDPGFCGNLTVELVNHGPEPVVYRRGDPLVQIIFTMLVGPTNRPYRGKYQHQTKAAHGPRYEVGE